MTQLLKLFLLLLVSSQFDTYYADDVVINSAGSVEDDAASHKNKELSNPTVTNNFRLFEITDMAGNLIFNNQLIEGVGNDVLITFVVSIILVFFVSR